MKTFLMDSDIISYLAEVESPYHHKIVEHFHQLADEDRIFLSILTIYELHYSIAHAEGTNIAKLSSRPNLSLATESKLEFGGFHPNLSLAASIQTLVWTSAKTEMRTKSQIVGFLQRISLLTGKIRYLKRLMPTRN
jgi:hypothetical protein